MAHFGLLEPFDIDNGELNGLSPQECFVLGVEWQAIANLAAKPDGFDKTVHAVNADRIRKILERRDRVYRLTHMPDDRSESWMELVVQPVE